MACKQENSLMPKTSPDALNTETNSPKEGGGGGGGGTHPQSHQAALGLHSRGLPSGISETNKWLINSPLPSMHLVLKVKSVGVE